MTNTRRGFLRTTIAAASSFHPAFAGHHTVSSEPLLDLSTLARFVDALPIPPRAQPSGPQNRYKIAMRQFEARAHRDMRPTTFWGYDGSSPGPTFDLRSAQAIEVEWINRLPSQHLFPIDHSLHGAEADKPAVRTVVHLHGGRVPPESDGYPERWTTPGQAAIHRYPNRQEAATLFYHDHAMAITRLNAAAGLVGFYFIRDDAEDALKLPAGELEVPLALCDRSFRPDGKLFYPVSPDPSAPWVSEYYGGGILVNGKLWPYLDVHPARHRFRILNASNGSFYTLSLSSGGPPLTFFQIGSDQGLLEAPAPLTRLILGPGERADVLIDFSAHAGERLRLSTEVIPVLEFRIGARAVPTTAPAPLPTRLRPIARTPESSALVTRPLTLADYQDRLGRSHRMLLNGCQWHAPVTEKPVLDSTEIWSFINLTDDSHPIHLHLVRFQILDRRPYDFPTYQLTGKIVFTGPAAELEPGERGWKDTVRVDPLTVTRIIVRFESYAGRYVWHCHMLEHEDNEMMRPYEIVSPDVSAR